MQMAVGNVMKLESAVLMFGKSRDAAAAKLLEKIEEPPGFSRDLPDHARTLAVPNSGVKHCVFFTTGNMSKHRFIDSALICSSGR